MGVSEAAEAVGGEAKPVSQRLGQVGCLRIEPIGVFSCRPCVTVGADRVAAAELASELVGRRRPWTRCAKGCVALESADEERVRVVEKHESVAREEFGGGLRRGQGSF